jgi:ribosomal protein S6
LAEGGVTFISDDYPKMMELAYQMAKTIANKKQKFSYGYFGWVKFEATSQAIISIKNKLDISDSLIRFLIIKTVKENTLSPRRSYGKQEGAPRRRPVANKEDATPAEPINEEVIDKEIDALVIE